MRSDAGSAALLAALLLTMAGCGQNPAPPASRTEAKDSAAAGHSVAAGEATSPAPKAEAPAPASATGNDDPSSQFEIGDLAGHWRVAGVAPGGGIEAYRKDDPAYMGLTLTIGSDRLAWDKPPSTRATIDDTCEGPVTQHLTGQARGHYQDEYKVQLAALGPTAGDAHGIECNDGHWGPEGDGGTTLWRARDGGLIMSWYDDIALKLVRTGQ